MGNRAFIVPNPMTPNQCVTDVLMPNPQKAARLLYSIQMSVGSVPLVLSNVQYQKRLAWNFP
jgi:hypothetical protein